MKAMQSIECYTVVSQFDGERAFDTEALALAEAQELIDLENKHAGEDGGWLSIDEPSHIQVKKGEQLIAQGVLVGSENCGYEAELKQIGN